MFDSINGVSLNDATREWDVERSTTQNTEYSYSAVSVETPSTDGYVVAGGTARAPAVTIAVITPPQHLDALLALMTAPNPMLGVYGMERSAAATVKSVSTRRARINERYVIVTGLYEIPGVYARDAVSSTSPALALGTTTVVGNVFDGISGIVADAIIRVKGSATGLRVTDGGGSWFSYSPNIPTGSYLRFYPETGKAYMTTSDSWSGGSDVSGAIDFNGPRGVFEITPHFTNPSNRTGELTVTTTARSGAFLEVRGRSAYLA